MIRLTVGKRFKHGNNVSLILDDHRRFARMLIFAVLLHLILFIAFDFKAHLSLKKIMATMIEVTLNPPEPIEIEYSQTTQDLSKQPHSTMQEGLIYNSAKPHSEYEQSETHIRKRTISAASHEKRDAPYLSRWQSYVEQFGNAHYPDVALKNKLIGDLRLLVALNKDGSLHEVSVRLSSGSAALDQAAIKLVHQAAPFEPLPPEITQDTDILEIIRTWQFRGEISN